MGTILLSLLFMFQGIPIQQGGTVTGILRSSDGKPAVGVRIAAVPQTDSADAIAGGPTLSSIAETDEQGRYKLESVPPGRYYITAGRLDLPTYYPGTQSMALGQAVPITPGLTVQGIDFVLNSTSAGRADPLSGSFGVTLLDLPVEVRVEGGGKLPVWSGGTLTAVQLTPVLGGVVVSIPITASRYNLSPPITDYKVAVEGLPDGYQVKSVKYGGADLPDRVLKITSIRGPNGILFPSAAAYAAYMAAFNQVNSSQPSGAQVLSIVLDNTAASTPRGPGARVIGSLPANMIRSIYLSGLPGTVFSDGTFEFRNVLPGRQTILTADNAPSRPALAALVVVGTASVSNVVLQSTPVLPPNIRTLTATSPAGDHAPGAVPLASLRGHVLDSETGTPLKAGTIFIIGDSWASFELGEEGRFEFPRLLPGTYGIEVQGVGYPTLRRTIVIEEQDVDLDLKAG